MREKYSVIRGESRLADLSPSIRALYDKKMSAIVARKEESEQEAQETENDLLATIAKLAIKNAEDIMKILEQGDLDLPEDEEPKDNENLETLTKSLESKSGVPLKMVKARKRVRIIE